MLSAALSLPFLLGLSGLDGTEACADSSAYADGTDFWAESSEGWESGSPERDACDPEEVLLFPRAALSPSKEGLRESHRASFSMTRNAGGPARRVLRQQAERAGWSHRLEIRGDTLTRRGLIWNGAGWRVAAGDLTDPELPIWHGLLPRRTLPLGWRANRRPRPALQGLTSPLPQGWAAGIVQPRWSAWAARAWNPVENGDEPPWEAHWNLRHVSTGISASFPWTLSALFTDTRIARGEVDSVAEQIVSAGLASPQENLAVQGAVSRAEGRGEGWALAGAARHRFSRSSTVEVTGRQRSAGWESSWDPAIAAGAAPPDSDAAAWGAGEVRMAGTWRPVRTEIWRAWNPRAGTARQGIRGSATWRAEDLALKLSGTHRTARAASGSVSLYRYLEAETRREGNPEVRAAAFRAWNGTGPTRTGFFFGLDPAWGDLRASSGLRLESNAEDRLSAQVSLGARWGFARGWNLDAAAVAPCTPHWSDEALRWRMTLNYAAR
jgi:hypothetical protein